MKRLLCLFWFFVASAHADVLLKDVSIEGNERVLESTIMMQISSQPGGYFEPRLVELDVKELYRTGSFQQVMARVEKHPDGVVLRYQVVEKPAIRNVYLQGNEEVDTDTLKEKLKVDERRFLDRQKLSAGVREAIAFYEERGFYGTDIDYVAEPVEDNAVDIVYKVDEGKELVIKEIRFEGNSAFEDEDLEDEIQTSTYSWWSSWLTGSGLLKEEQLKADQALLSRYYLTRGYVDFQTGEPEVEALEDHLRVTYKVREGEKYQFGEIRAQGDLLPEGEEETLEGIESVSGETFNVEAMRKDAFTITEKFTNIGYAFTNTAPETQIDRENRLVNLNFVINKGGLVRVRRINVSGNEKTKDNVVRRSLAIQEQELFSSSKVQRSQQWLQRLGYFDEVTITPEATDVEDEVDLNVSVREGNTGSFSAGFGYSSGDGFIGTLRITETNLWGTGNSISLNIDTGSRNQNFIISYDDPRINDTRWSGGIDILSVERQFDDFVRDQKGGSVTVGYPLVFLDEKYLDDIRFSFRYEYLSIDITDVEPQAAQLIQDSEGKTSASSITPGIIRNTINNPLNPTGGSRQLVSFEFAGLGGEEEFWLASINNTWYYPIAETSFGTFVFSQRTRFGWGETFNDEQFPLFKRFFEGGINSVRGFDARELGPQDEEGSFFGGNKRLVGNFEVIFPIVDSAGFNGVTFFDAGNAFDDEESMSFSNLRFAWGWGIRWRSPLAPIRIEFGYPIDREEGENSVVTHFSFGAPL